MLATYAIGNLTMKFSLSGLVSNQVLEATVGLLSGCDNVYTLQLRGHLKGYVCPGYEKITQMEDTSAGTEPPTKPHGAL